MRIHERHNVCMPARFLVGLALAVAPCSLAAAQEPSRDPGSAPLTTGSVAGVVRDSSGLPVSTAQVTVAGLLVRSSTGSDGVFRIAGVPTGSRTIRVRRIGFRPDSVQVEILPGAETKADVTIGAAVQQIAPLVVEAGNPRYTGRMASFFRRRDRSQGHFFTAEDIDRRDPMVTTDLLRMIPGVRLESYRGENVVFFRGQQCAPLVWIDGMPATAGYLNPDYFTPRSLAGIEVYSGVSTVPPELMWVRGKGACGVISLWTRLDDPPGKTPERKVSAQELANLVASLRLHTAEQVDEPARADTSEPVTPFYPDSLLRSGIGGRVLAEFVVDTTGHAEMETFGIVLSSDRLFTDAVRRAVAAARFVPARLGNQAVRQLMQIPISFIPVSKEPSAAAQRP